MVTTSLTPPFLPKDVPDVATLHDPVNKITYNFPFNINSLEWSYQMNSQSYSTIGGRVTQLLSVRVNTMALQGEAGNRSSLVELYNNFKKMQDVQNQYKSSMVLTVPSRGLSYNVWLQSMQIAWDVTTVTYPYSMMFEMQQDLTGSTNEAATVDALNQLVAAVSGMGYSDIYTGLSTATVNLQFSNIQSDLSGLSPWSSS